MGRTFYITVGCLKNNIFVPFEITNYSHREDYDYSTGKSLGEKPYVHFSFANGCSMYYSQFNDMEDELPTFSTNDNQEDKWQYTYTTAKDFIQTSKQKKECGINVKRIQEILSSGNYDDFDYDDIITIPELISQTEKPSYVDYYEDPEKMLGPHFKQYTYAVIPKFPLMYDIGICIENLFWNLDNIIIRITCY